MVEKLFFELLQIAIGTRLSLSVAPSANQWSELFALSKKHALFAIAFHGLSLLRGRSSNADDNDNLSTIPLYPWMICEPNEKEGKFLLNEIMQAGNFGKYDERIKRDCSQFSHAMEKIKHNLRLLIHYPEEVLWEPFFYVYHWIWRRFELWRY